MAKDSRTPDEMTGAPAPTLQDVAAMIEAAIRRDRVERAEATPAKMASAAEMEEARITAFFKPENIRPATERYAIFPTDRPSLMFPLFLAEPTVTLPDGSVRAGKPGLLYKFKRPPHGIGSDLFDKDKGIGYRVLYVDFLDHSMLNITQGDLDILKAAGQVVRPDIKPHPGFYSVLQVMEAVAANYGPDQLGNDTVSFGQSGEKRFLNGESFRRWAFPIYQERAEKLRRKQAQLTAVSGVNLLDGMTGRGLDALKLAASGAPA